MADANHKPARPSQALLWGALRTLGVLVVVGSLWLALRGMHLAEVWAALRRAHVLPLLFSAMLSLCNMGLKAEAWRVMLAPQYRIPRLSMVRYTWLAAAISQVTPLRAGEAMRVWLLASRHSVPWPVAASTAVLEKVLDAALMVVVVGPVFWLWPDIPPWACRGALAVLTAFFIAAAVLWATARYGRRHRRLRHLVAAALSLRRPPRRLAWCSVLLLGAWLLDLGMIWSTMSALDVVVPRATALIMLLAINMAIAVPTTPGQFGTFELAATGVLMWLQVPGAVAFSFGLLYHAVQVGPLLIILLCEMRLVSQALRSAKLRHVGATAGDSDHRIG